MPLNPPESSTQSCLLNDTDSGPVTNIANAGYQYEQKVVLSCERLLITLMVRLT